MGSLPPNLTALGNAAAVKNPSGTVAFKYLLYHKSQYQSDPGTRGGSGTGGALVKI